MSSTLPVEVSQIIISSHVIHNMTSCHIAALRRSVSFWQTPLQHLSASSRLACRAFLPSSTHCEVLSRCASQCKSAKSALPRQPHPTLVARPPTDAVGATESVPLSTPPTHSCSLPSTPAPPRTEFTKQRLPFSSTALTFAYLHAKLRRLPAPSRTPPSSRQHLVPK